MADIIISDLPVVQEATTDDFFILNDGNVTTTIVSFENILSSTQNLTTVGFSDGTAALPSVTFTSDPNTGIYRAGPDNWAVSTNAVQRLVINESGNVGINQPSPGNFFNGTNNLVVGDTSLGDNGITIVASSSDVGTISFADGTTGTQQYEGQVRYDHTDDHMHFTTAGFEAMRIDAEGDVGIGQPEPLNKLHITIDHLDDGILITNASNEVIELFGEGTGGDNGTLNLKNGGTQNVHITATGSSYLLGGNVGIGTDNPSTSIHVASIGSPTIRLENTDDNTSGRTNRLQFSFEDQIGSEIRTSRPNGATDLTGVFQSFRVGGNSTSEEVMRLQADGNVGIGTTDPATKLEVVDTSPEIRARSTGNSTSILALDNDRAADLIGGQIYGRWNGNAVSAIRFINGADGTNKDDGVITFSTSNANSSLNERLRITQDGNVGIGTTDPGAKLEVQGTLLVDQTTTINGSVVLTGSSPSGTQITTPVSNTIAFDTGGSERFRISSGGAIGLGGANYGTAGQVLSSNGPSAQPTWTSIASGVPDISTLDPLP